MKGERLIIIGVLLLGVLVLPGVANAESFIEAGLWRIKIWQQVNGKPKSEPVIYMQCIEDLKKLTVVLKPEPNCSVYNILVRTTKISWDIHCVSKSNSSDGSAKLLKSNGKLTGKIDMRVAIPGVTFSMPTVREVIATHTGDCNK